MNTCHWRENWPAAAVESEESLDNVIRGEWCNTRQSHAPTLLWLCCSSMSLERKKRRRKKRSVSETNLHQRNSSGGSSGSSRQSLSGEKLFESLQCQNIFPHSSHHHWPPEWQHLSHQSHVQTCFRRQQKQSGFIDQPQCQLRQWTRGVSERVSSMKPWNLLMISLSEWSWCWVTWRSCVTITNTWCCREWRLLWTTLQSWGEESTLSW